MAEITAVLVALGVVLAVVTIIGHGIWVMLGALFGAGRRQDSRTLPPHQAEGCRACPRCLTALGVGSHICTVCGWPQEVGRQPNPEAGLAAVREQLNRFAWLGVLDESTRSTLASVIHDQETQVTQLRSAAALAKLSQAAQVEAAPPASAVDPAEPQIELVEIAPPPTAPATVAQRAGRYAASRAEAQAEGGPIETAASAAPTVPVSRLLSAFMEEKNIRWGELVGGLLIVGCSIALVISFWSQIATRPLLKFVLFNGVTAALFGAGLYTDRRWKIHTTSHGILIIATLLVPLNFLAIAAFTQASPPTDFLSLAGEAVSLIVFSLFLYLAGRILVPNAAPHLVVAVMVPSMMQLLVRRFAEPATPLTWLYALSGVPIASYVATTLLTTSRTAGPAVRTNQNTLSDSAATRNTAEPAVLLEMQPELPLETQLQRTLTFLGLASAATLLPLALLAYKVPTLETTLHKLSPLIAISGLPALLVGLLFWRQSRGWGRAQASPADWRAEPPPEPPHPRRRHTRARRLDSRLQTCSPWAPHR